MDERYGVECPEQQFQRRQSLVKKNKSEIKQDKKMSKTESRFKSKLESLRKFQHSASASGAVEKARAFFRSLELRHHGSTSHSDHSSSSSSHQCDSNSKNSNIHLSSSKAPLPSSLSSSSSSSIIDDTQNTLSALTTTHDSSLNSKQSSNCIATARIIRVINPKDTIVQQVKHFEQDDHQPLTSSYFKSSPIRLQKPVQPCEPYFNQHNKTYSSSYEKQRNTQIEYNCRPLSPVSTLNPNITYSSRLYHNPAPVTYSTLSNGNYSNNEMSTSLYNYRPLVCRQMDLSSSSSVMSSSFHEQSDRLTDSIIRPLPTSNSSSSMSSWTQSVRRLNSEYKSTINALQQAKESLKQIYCEPPPDTISKYANFVARGIDNLSNSETNKSMGVSFCLTAQISQDSLSLSSSSPSSSQISKSSIQQPKTPPLNAFTKPKIVRPLELNSFTPPPPPPPPIASIPKLEPVQINIEKNDKVHSIANIIQKFNNLNNLSSTNKSSLIIENNYHIEPIKNNKESKSIISNSIEIKKDPIINHSQSNSSPRVHFQPTVTTYELEEIPYESPPPPLSSSSSSSLASEDTTSSTSSSNINPIDPINQLNSPVQEETTYTVETFYKNDDEDMNLKNLLTNNQQVVIIRENATEEQFKFLQEKQQLNKQILSQPKYTINQSNSSPLTTPLFTYLNLNLKQTTPTPPPHIEKQETTKHDNSKHSIDPIIDLTKNFISTINHEKDDETINDVVTANPYTYSPPSHRLISSSSSSSTTSSSAATVLLSNHTNTSRPNSTDLTKTSTTINGNSTKTNINNKSQSQLPKRTITSPVAITNNNNSRLKQPTKLNTNLSKLKPPSTSISSTSTNSKPMKSMTSNSSTSTSITTTSTSSLRKPSAVTNQSSTMTNNSLNKNTQQQTSSSIPTGKRHHLLNGTTSMTDSQNPSDSSMSLGKNRVRSMVNQFNAASTSNRPTNSSTMSNKRTPTPSTTTSGVNSRRPITSTESPNKTSMVNPNRPSLQRALTINNQIPVSPSPPSTPSNTNNNTPSAYKRKAPLIRSTSNVKEGLLRWCQAQVAGYPNVSVTNLSSSWSDGLAFCALTHHFFPDAFDFNSLTSNNRQENFELAFRTAEERGDVPRLLDVSDMLVMGNTPDYKCIFTYLNTFLAKVKDIHPTNNTVQCR